ncbi:MAG: hypothetical protein ACJLS2_01605 [Microcella pacifica]
MSVNDDLYVIVATAADGYLFGDGSKTKTFSISLLPADENAVRRGHRGSRHHRPLLLQRGAPGRVWLLGLRWSHLVDHRRRRDKRLVRSAVHRTGGQPVQQRRVDPDRNG